MCLCVVSVLKLKLLSQKRVSKRIRHMCCMFYYYLLLYGANSAQRALRHEIERFAEHEINCIYTRLIRIHRFV